MSIEIKVYAYKFSNLNYKYALSSIIKALINYTTYFIQISATEMYVDGAESLLS